MRACACTSNHYSIMIACWCPNRTLEHITVDTVFSRTAKVVLLRTQYIILRATGYISVSVVTQTERFIYLSVVGIGMTYLHYDRTHRFDTSMGTGAALEIDDIIDDEAIIENDGRSLTRTMFYASEVSYDSPKRRRQMERLAKWNDGMWDSSRASQNFKADMNRIKEGFCQEIELTDFQTECVLWTMERMPVNRFGSYNTEKVTMAVITIICERDRRPVDDEPAFQNIMKDIGMTGKQLRSVRKICRKYPFAFDSTLPIPEEYQ
ncbi:hypothetical protein M1M34_gp002 [Haloarcula tailed virus 2]|uniref:Uncharacterized protein n=1 Tax=Haloarcula tailed virus 2 TaxID=2877989 RepID=A0AAE9BYI5_9CAUD|nr:hypothetical protein M1M34_gp002 [Haloarcula tailed virus 2]UBF23153.1 hypothetical protein HATV-2_gp2 [Haloarcula tailed virus 2]